ncbi:MAG: HU family DNA-binding protein [Chloroflexota bacterium]
MSVKIHPVERANPLDRQAPKKFFPNVEPSGRVTTRDLADMGAQRSTFSPIDMMAAMECLLRIIPEQLARGNVVELGEFGSFWLRNESEGVATAEEVNGSLITSLRPKFTPGKLFKKVLADVTFEKA